MRTRATDHRTQLGERFREARLSMGARLVFVAMLTYANHEDWRNVWTSIVTLSKVTGLTRRNVQLAVGRLVVAGLVVVEEPATPGRTARYALIQGASSRRRRGCVG